MALFNQDSNGQQIDPDNPPGVMDTLGFLSKLIENKYQQMVQGGQQFQMAQAGQPKLRQGQASNGGSGGGMNGGGQQQGGPQQPQDPNQFLLQQGMKSVAKKQDEHIQQAMDAGVPGQHILGQLLQKVGGTITNAANTGLSAMGVNGTAGQLKQIAEQVPPTQMEQKQLQAGGYTAQVGALKDQLDAIDKTRQIMTQQMNDIMQHPVVNMMTGGPNVKNIRAQVDQLNTNFNNIQKQLTSLVNNPPNRAKAGPSSQDKVLQTARGIKYKVVQ